MIIKNMLKNLAIDSSGRRGGAEPDGRRGDGKPGTLLLGGEMRRGGGQVQITVRRQAMRHRRP